MENHTRQAEQGEGGTEIRVEERRRRRRKEVGGGDGDRSASWLQKCYNPTDPKTSTGTFLGKTRVWTDTSVPLFINQSRRVGSGGREGAKNGDESQPSTGFGILDLAVAGGSLEQRGWQGDVLVMQGRRRGPHEVFVLTAVMHGVAGDDHRRGHGNGGAAHAELIGDGIICTAAARLASSGSWKEKNRSCKMMSHQIGVKRITPTRRSIFRNTSNNRNHD